jgi:O-antigen/teichoic acid export membrane protein
VKPINQCFHDPLLRRLFKNAGVLFSGNVAESLLGLASLAITARAMGVEQFGMLILITTYVLIVDKLINFQSWQAIIKYGADALEHKREEDFESLIKLGFLLDGSTAVLGAVIAACAAWVVGGWLGWQQEHVLMAIAYSVTVLFNISGTPIAILRLFDKFKKTAAQQVYAAIIKLIGVSVAYIMDAGLWAFLFVWAVVDILGKILLLYYASRELTVRNITAIGQCRISAISSRFHGIWRFVWTTNLHASVKLGIREVDIILVGGILGPAAAGLYKIVKAVGSTVVKVSDPLYHAIYPELARQVSAKDFDKFAHLIYAPMKLLIILVIPAIGAFYLVGEDAIRLLLGDEYIGAFMPALFYIVGSFIGVLTFAFHPALLSLGKAHLSFFILIVTTAIYLSTLYIFTHSLGLVGASLSYILFYASWAILQFLVIKMTKNRETACVS